MFTLVSESEPFEITDSNLGHLVPNFDITYFAKVGDTVNLHIIATSPNSKRFSMTYVVHMLNIKNPIKIMPFFTFDFHDDFFFPLDAIFTKFFSKRLTSKLAVTILDHRIPRNKNLQ